MERRQAFQGPGSVEDIWIRLHSTQTDFCFGQELSWYFTSSAWLQSERVIDLGTGSGYYLHRLAEIFPEKDFHGIDVNDVFLSTAKRAVRGRNVHFDKGDVCTVEGQYDAAIIRLVMQHLNDVEAALQNLVRLLRPGGVAFIIDAADHLRYFYPVPEEYVRFFAAYTSSVTKEGRDRDVAAKIPDLIATRIPNLRCSGCGTTIIPSTVAGNLPLFQETYYLVIELLEMANALAYDFSAVKRAWLDWCDLPRTYMQVGIRCVTVVRQ
jgi:ubiquinone/menaquinone biosynthesis C-methylase UbiE